MVYKQILLLLYSPEQQHKNIKTIKFYIYIFIGLSFFFLLFHIKILVLVTHYYNYSVLLFQKLLSNAQCIEKNKKNKEFKNWEHSSQTIAK